MRIVTIFFLSIFFLIVSSCQLLASGVEMADQLRSEGKIYAVVAILLIIFIGISAFLLFIERRLNSLEKQQKVLKK